MIFVAILGCVLLPHLAAAQEAQEVIPPAASSPAAASQSYVDRLVALRLLRPARKDNPEAVKSAIKTLRQRIASAAEGELTPAELSIIAPSNEMQYYAARTALKTQLQDSLLKRKLVASGVLNSDIEGAPLSILWAAAVAFRKAIGSEGLGPLSEAELVQLDVEAKAFEDFAGLQEMKYEKRDASIVLPLKLVNAAEEGDSDYSWLTYQSADKAINIDFFINPTRSSTSLSLAATLLERRRDMTFDKLDLSGDEFVIEGSALLPSGVRGLVLMQGRQRISDVIGHGIRTSTDAPAGLALPNLKALSLPVNVSPFPTRAQETPDQRKWRIVVKILSNLIASDFRKLNGYEYLSTQDCRGVSRERARLRKTVNIVYATARKPTDASNAVGPQPLGSLYSSEQGSELSIGCLKVSIATPTAPTTASSSAGEMNRSDTTPLESAAFETNVPWAPRRLGIGDKRNFAFRADERLAVDDTERALLFIHGYNNSFEDAVQRAAQIAAASDYDGFIYVFSWPSQGRFASYAADMDFAETSEPELVRFMKMILTAGTPVRLDVIAHSMGSQIFLRSLEGLRSVFDVRVGNSGWDRLRFGQLIFAAPDVSVPLFQRKIAQIRPFADRVTVYASANDGALDVSGWLRGDLSRAGAIRPGEQPMYADDVDVIDITGNIIPRYLVSRYYYRTHSAFAYDPAVVEDIGDILAQSWKRGSVRFTPVTRARLALRGDKFAEETYAFDPAGHKKWWKLKVEPQVTVVDQARDVINQWWASAFSY